VHIVLTKISIKLFRSKPDYITIVTFADSTFLLQRFYSGSTEASYTTTKLLFCYSNVMSLEVVVILVSPSNYNM